MTTDVYVSVVLRDHCGGKSSFALDGKSVREIVEAIDHEYPGFREHVVAPDGSIVAGARVSVNGQDVASIGGADAPVKQGDRVYLLYAIAGG
jgi:molybdopterin converting factor small subunit